MIDMKHHYNIFLLASALMAAPACFLGKKISEGVKMIVNEAKKEKIIYIEKEKEVAQFRNVAFSLPFMGKRLFFTFFEGFSIIAGVVWGAIKLYFFIQNDE